MDLKKIILASLSLDNQITQEGGNLVTLRKPEATAFFVNNLKPIREDMAAMRGLLNNNQITQALQRIEMAKGKIQSLIKVHSKILKYDKITLNLGDWYNQIRTIEIWVIEYSNKK